MTDLARAVAAGDLDELIRIVDGLASAREWAAIVELRDRCRHALEQRGLQLWPAAEYAEYRLALHAPAEFAGAVVTEEAGRFALGPLWEVAASTHQWGELEPYLAAGPARSLVAHERVLRGEVLSADDSIDLQVLEIPLQAIPWEPAYSVATYAADKIDFAPPTLPRLERTDLPVPTAEIEDDESLEALIDIGAVWASQSNGSAEAKAVQGTAEQAIAALGHRSCLLAPVAAASAIGLLAWAGADGGAYGRRRGAAVGRFLAWWAGAALVDAGWPADAVRLGADLEALRWVVWEPEAFTGGWSACVAAESRAEGMAWALEAVDSYREEDALKEEQ